MATVIKKGIVLEKDKIPFERKILVCTHDDPQKEACCGARKGIDIFKELRKIAKERGIHPRIRVGQAKCLGKCACGANVMIYPENIWYSAVSMDDIQTIANAHMTVDS